MTREEARADLMLAQADISYRPKDESIDMAIEALENQKTGHWVKNEEMSIMFDIWTCSECGGGGAKHFKYCAFCGAKMEGESNAE